MALGQRRPGAGAIPRLVRFTADQLNAVHNELNQLAAGSSAGMVRSWYVDPVSGTVVVTVPKGRATRSPSGS